MKNYTNYLEYGSGSSTRYFCKYDNLNIISVESDSFYAKAVRESVSSNSKVKVIDSETGITGFWGVPLFFASSREKGWKYVNTPWRNFCGTYQPDVILIDGRYRVACAINILLRVANKHRITIFFDDYLGRDDYYIFEKYCNLEYKIDRMAIFKYNLKPISEKQLLKLKYDLQIYLTKFE